jgi:hypothetical protein
MLTRLTGASFHPVLGRKTEKPLNPYWFGSNPCICQATAMHFPTTNAGLIFLTDELTHDRYRIWLTLSIVLCTSKTNPSGSLPKGADGQTIPS